MCPRGGPRWTVCTFCLGSDTGPAGWCRCGLPGLHSAGDYAVRPPSPSLPGFRDMHLKVMTLYSDDRCASLPSSLSPVVRRGGLTTESFPSKASAWLCVCNSGFFLSKAFPKLYELQSPAPPPRYLPATSISPDSASRVLFEPTDAPLFMWATPTHQEIRNIRPRPLRRPPPGRLGGAWCRVIATGQTLPSSRLRTWAILLSPVASLSLSLSSQDGRDY